MKKWIHASTDTFDYSKLIINEDYTEEDDLSIGEAIADMAYQTYDNYYADYVNENITEDDLVDIVIEHLDDPEIYGLKVGVDYSRDRVVSELNKYL